MRKNSEYENTNLKLLEAFNKITLAGKKVTVPNLCKEANIHDQTFYKHFATKDLFVSYAVKRRLDLFFEANKDLSFVNYFSLVLETCYREKNRPGTHIQDYFIKSIIYTNLEELIKKKIIYSSKISNELDREFITGGILFFISKSLKNNNQKDYLHSKEQLQLLVAKTFKNYL